MKGVFRLLALTCLLWGGCGDQGKVSPAAQKPAASSESPKAPPAASPKVVSKPVEATVPGPKPEAVKQPAEAAKTDLEKRLEEMYPMPSYRPLEEIVGNWEEVPQNVVDAVKVITVNSPAEYKLFANGVEIGSRKVEAGHPAKPLKFRPGKLLVTNSRDGNTTAVVDLEATDFQDQVRAIYNEQVEKGKERVMAARKSAGQAMSQGGAGPAGGTGEFGSANSDPRFKPAVDYLAQGKMITRNLDEAKRWMWLGKETHEGKNYDVILVHFEVETIFGKFPHSMKCLMENGRVVNWIMAGYGD